ncbi:hypothetical protein A5661_02440 [Mycobacterium asiaticum]|nr:hypothetical protein A5661_02440 [Mycobacterium asiaticum]
MDGSHRVDGPLSFVSVDGVSPLRDGRNHVSLECRCEQQPHSTMPWDHLIALPGSEPRDKLRAVVEHA